MRYFSSRQYGQDHRQASDPTLAICGRPVPDDARLRTVTAHPKGECPRCRDDDLPDYTKRLWPERRPA